MNRLLFNMKNKVEVLNGAIIMCDKLAKGETVHLNGLYKFDVTIGNNSKEDIINRKIK